MHPLLTLLMDLYCEKLKTTELLSSSVIYQMASILQAVCIAEMCTETHSADTTKHWNCMSTLITQAFRPLSARARRDSGSSFNSEDSSQKQDPLI